MHQIVLFESLSEIHGPLAGGLGVALGIYVGFKLSGGHVNPAVCFQFWVSGDLGGYSFQSLKRLGCYLLAQTSGAFLSAALIYGLYLDASSAAR